MDPAANLDGARSGNAFRKFRLYSVRSIGVFFVAPKTAIAAASSAVKTLHKSDDVMYLFEVYQGFYSTVVRFDQIRFTITLTCSSCVLLEGSSQQDVHQVE